MALALHASPMYFYRRGKGRYQAAPEENLKAALAGLEKKRRQQEQVDAWAAALAAGTVPAEIAAKLDALLFKPDKMSLEWRALDQAATARRPRAAEAARAASARSPGPRTTSCAASPSSSFRTGWLSRRCRRSRAPQGLPAARVPAFSIDDHETTEIDDAFSVERLADGRLRVGVHIAAPALFFGRDHRPRGDRARAALDRVLPRRQDHDAARGGHRGGHARRGPRGADGLALPRPRPGHARDRGHRVAAGADRDRDEPAHRGAGDAPARGIARGRPVEGAHGEDLLLLWRLAKKLRAARGAGEEKSEKLDYTFRVEGGRVAIEPRRRGTPIDVLVSELMIHVNATWGRMLAEAGVAGDLPQPARHQDAHGSGARRARMAGRHALRVVQLAAAALHRPRQPAPARRAAARRARPLFRARSSPPRRASSRRPTRPTPSTSATSSATGACAGSPRRASRGRTPRSIRDELVRLDGIPLVCRTIGLPPSAPGERVRVAFGEPDPWEVNLPCRYAGKPGSG